MIKMKITNYLIPYSSEILPILHNVSYYIFLQIGLSNESFVCAPRHTCVYVCVHVYACTET